MKSLTIFIVLMTGILSSACNSSGGGSHIVGGAKSSDKAITAFSFTSPPVTGTISETTKSIAVAIPLGTDLTALVATFTTTGIRVTVNGVAQVSGTTPNDFTNPVVYTAIAADGTTVSYTVTVTPTSGVTTVSDKALLTYSLAGVAGTINEASKTIAVVLPPDGTSVTDLVATFTTSGATVKVSNTVQVNGTTPNDFTLPVVYTVTATDNTSASYTVTVSILTGPKLLSSFSFDAVPASGVINEASKTVAITIPLGPPLTTLVASFTTSNGAIVKVGSGVQASGTTVNNFTNPVVYRIIAPDGLEKDYTVTVTIAPAALTGMSFASVPAIGIVDQSVRAVAAFVPARTPVSALVSSFTVTNTAAVQVGGMPQANGITPNDFTGPVVYTLIDGYGLPVTYTITVTSAPGLLNLPKTGQIVSYATSSASRDDGILQKGVAWPSPRFTNYGGSVADNLTGLAWQPNGSTPPTAGLCSAGTTTNWGGALTYVACLNTNSYLGQTDWRLPNINELLSLATANTPDVSSWLNSLGFSSMQGNIYFSSTTDAAAPTTQARTINMQTGNAIVSLKNESLGVIAVRSALVTTAPSPVPQTGQTTSSVVGDDGSQLAGIAWPATRFSNPDKSAPPITGSLVVDQLTGLMWTQDGDTPDSASCPTSGTWEAALAYVTCLNANTYLGYGDWRLPNVNELESLINAEQVNSAAWLNTQGFSNVAGNAYWSSTTDPTTTANAWVVFLAGGDKDSAPKTSTGIKAWPVRSGY